MRIFIFDDHEINSNTFFSKSIKYVKIDTYLPLGDFMNKSAFRQSMIEILYLKSMDGNYTDNLFDEEVINVCNDVFFHIDEIDSIISNNLLNWTIDRLNYVDKAIIRYAVYEMKFKDVPIEIAINEAINMTRKFSNLDDDQAKSFNNRLLDNISQNLNLK